MELEKQQELLTRWIDSDLAGDDLRDFEKAVAANPELAEAKAEADSLRHLLKADMPDREIPNPEFFNSQIQRRIAPEEASAASTTPAPASNIFSWFRSPFTLASAAAVALGLFFLSQVGGDSPLDHTSVASTYTPDAGIEASHFYSDDADATVIMLDGLAALPDATELNGQNIVSTEPGSPNQLYNEDSQLAFVIMQGADSIPIIRAFY